MGEVIPFDRQRFFATFPSKFRHVEESCWSLYNDLKRANISTATQFYSEFDHEAGDEFLCLEILPKSRSQMTAAYLIAFSYQRHLRTYNIDLMLISHGVYSD